MATPEEEALINRIRSRNRGPVTIDPLKPIFGGETDEEINARRADEKRKADAARLAQEQADRAGRQEQLDIEKFGQDRNKQSQDLQTRYRGYDSYKKYTAAVGLYNAGLNTQPNTAGDLDLITYAAKMRDPTTGVLGGEAEQTKKIENLVNQVKAQVSKEFGWEEGGTLTPEGRDFLRNSLRNTFENNYKPLYLQDREYFKQEATASGFDPIRIVGPDPYDAYKDSIEKYWKDREGAQNGAGGEGGPNITVTPEESIATFGELTYDKNGKLVGRAYYDTNDVAYDAQGNEIGLIKGVSPSQVEEPAPSFFGGLARSAVESVTGQDRSTTATESLPDWVEMPELQQLFSMPAFKSALGTAFGGGPQEIAQIVQNNFPDTKVYQDEKGNYILESASSGKRYAIKPGFQLSDVPRALSIILTGAGGAEGGLARTALREGGLQAGIETTQAATGGTFNPEDVIAAGVTGAGGQKLAEVLPYAAGRVIGTMRRGGPAIPNAAALAPELPGGLGLSGIRAAGGSVPPAAAAPTAPVPNMGVGAEVGGEVAPRVFEAGETVTSRAGGAMGTSPETMRITQAEGLPVPVELTRGAATRDPEQLAFEKEQIFGALGGPLRKRSEENNLQALQNFDRFIDMTGAEAPDIAATGNSVIKALSKGYQASKNRVRAAYTKADKAGETSELVPYGAIVDFINGQTPTTRTTLAPILQSTLEKLKMEDPTGTGQISIRALEDVRKSINKAVQPGTPNEGYGSAIKGMIDDATEGVGGDLYKEARRLRIEQGDLFEKRAIVARLVSNIKNMDDRKVPADRVFQSVILNESPENIKFLRQTLNNLGDDGKQAWSELQAATLRHIQDKATSNVNLTSENLPVVSAAQLNKVVSELDKNGRLDMIFTPKMAQQVRDLRDVVQYINTVPPGTSVNNSGTARTIMAMLGEGGLTAWATGGIPVPVITGLKLIRDQVKDSKIKKQISRSLLPRGE